MQIQLKERTEETVKVYYEKSQDPRITATLPRRDITLEQALEEVRGRAYTGFCSNTDAFTASVAEYLSTL